jgi:hypothetical protein
MNDQSSLPVQALPDGKAELRLVLQLSWEEVAALGREAGRLAGRLQRPVSLDEAVGHQLRTWSSAAAAARTKEDPPQPRTGVPTSASPMALTVGSAGSPIGSPVEPVRNAVQQPDASVPHPPDTHQTEARPAPAHARVSSLAGRTGTEPTTAVG